MKQKSTCPNRIVNTGKCSKSCDRCWHHSRQISPFLSVLFITLFHLFSGLSVHSTLRAQTNGFVHAYDSMHQVFSVYYPMGNHKAVDWNQLNLTIRPKIENAAASGDTLAFYTALQEYATSIHDGHINLRHGWTNIRAASIFRQIGGSYGFVVTGLDDGRVVSSLIEAGSPADLAGMKFGSEIVEVNDAPVHQVLDTVKVLWAELIPATLEAKKLNQYRFIGRAPIGHSMKVKFKNRGASEPTTATLIAVNDNYSTYNQTSVFPVYYPDSSVTAEILPSSGYGYIKLTSVYGDSAGIIKLYTDFRDAIASFIEGDVQGLILDLRSNYGGADALAAALSGFFYNEKAFYERLAWYNPETDTLEIVPDPMPHFNPLTLEFQTISGYPDGVIYTEPQQVCFDKPLIVMTGPRNISSGEGLAMILQKLPQCKVVSFFGSNGSFGLVERQHFLFPSPSDLYLRYPYGVSLDQNYAIQLDSDSTMTGGVRPDIRVPINDTVIDQLYLQAIDVELNYAVKVLRNIMDIEDPQISESGLVFEPVYPNPVLSTAAISYSLGDRAVVSVSIFDAFGKLVKTIKDEVQEPGLHNAVWNPEGFAPGIYFCLIRANKSIKTQRIVVL